MERVYSSKVFSFFYSLCLKPGAHRWFVSCRKCQYYAWNLSFQHVIIFHHDSSVKFMKSQFSDGLSACSSDILITSPLPLRVPVTECLPLTWSGPQPGERGEIMCTGDGGINSSVCRERPAVNCAFGYLVFACDTAVPSQLYGSPQCAAWCIWPADYRRRRRLCFAGRAVQCVTCYIWPFSNFMLFSLTTLLRAEVRVPRLSPKKINLILWTWPHARLHRSPFPFRAHGSFAGE